MFDDFGQDVVFYGLTNFLKAAFLMLPFFVSTQYIWFDAEQPATVGSQQIPDEKSVDVRQ